MNALTVNGKQLTLYGVEIIGYGVPAPVLEEVTIGTQTWKTKNLAIDDGQGGIYTQTVNYGQGDVVEYYYTWNAAVRVAASISGWHLPTTTEFDTLATAVGGSDVAGTKLKSTTGWLYGKGTNDFGFSVFPAGYWLSGSFNYLGYYSFLWTANEHSSSYAYRSQFNSSESMTLANGRMTDACSVRLIKDAT